MDDDETIAGTLQIVATPIGNLGDISRRAQEALAGADVIAAEDTRSARRLLSHLGISKPRLLAYFSPQEAHRGQEIVRLLREGKRVVLISDAGTPGISDPGERLVREAIAAGTRVQVVPGPTAAIAALVGSGLATQPFVFLGFLPRKRGPRQQLLGSYAGVDATIVLHESPRRIAQTVDDAIAAWGGSRRCALARELTKVHEEYVRCSLAELREHLARDGCRGECTLVIEGAPASPAASVDVEASVRALLGDGLGPRDVAQRLALQTGQARRLIYQLALSLQRELGARGEDAAERPASGPSDPD